MIGCLHACVNVCSYFYLIFSFSSILITAKMKVLAVHTCKCMLICINLNAEIVKYSKYSENFTKNILNLIMPEIPKWSDILLKSYSE